MAKKDFTKADGAIDKMFSVKKKEDLGVPPQTPKKTSPLDPSFEVSGQVVFAEVSTNNTNHDNDVKYTYNANITNDVNISNNANITRVTNKSRHYDERGPRRERFGLLMDGQLKDDLAHLSKVTGYRSVNDLVVTVLLEYVGRADSQARLGQYRKLL